jgi:hypothetical protein
MNEEFWLVSWQSVRFFHFATTPIPGLESHQFYYDSGTFLFCEYTVGRAWSCSCSNSGQDTLGRNVHKADQDDCRLKYSPLSLVLFLWICYENKLQRKPPLSGQTLTKKDLLSSVHISATWSFSVQYSVFNFNSIAAWNDECTGVHLTACRDEPPSIAAGIIHLSSPPPSSDCVAESKLKCRVKALHVIVALFSRKAHPCHAIAP